MPGATGQQKYIKYFSSQDRVKTVLKSPQKESYIKAFDVAMKGKSVLNGIQLQKGKEIEYINEGEYVFALRRLPDFFTVVLTSEPSKYFFHAVLPELLILLSL